MLAGSLDLISLSLNKGSDISFCYKHFIGQVSSRAGGAVPFAPFPMEFNEHPGRRMVDLLISDFTINSLLFQLHRFSFRFV